MVQYYFILKKRENNSEYSHHTLVLVGLEERSEISCQAKQEGCSGRFCLCEVWGGEGQSDL